MPRYYTRRSTRPVQPQADPDDVAYAAYAKALASPLAVDHYDDDARRLVRDDGQGFVAKVIAQLHADVLAGRPTCVFHAHALVIRDQVLPTWPACSLCGQRSNPLSLTDDGAHNLCLARAQRGLPQRPEQMAYRVECGCYFCKTFDQVQDLAPRAYLLAAQATLPADNGGHTPECEGSCHPSCPIGQARKADADRRAQGAQAAWDAANRPCGALTTYAPAGVAPATFTCTLAAGHDGQHEDHARDQQGRSYFVWTATDQVTGRFTDEEMARQRADPGYWAD